MTDEVRARPSAPGKLFARGEATFHVRGVTYGTFAPGPDGSSLVGMRRGSSSRDPTSEVMRGDPDKLDQSCVAPSRPLNVVYPRFRLPKKAWKLHRKYVKPPTECAQISATAGRCEQSGCQERWVRATAWCSLSGFDGVTHASRDCGPEVRHPCQSPEPGSRSTSSTRARMPRGAVRVGSTTTAAAASSAAARPAVRKLDRCGRRVSEVYATTPPVEPLWHRPAAP
jgi:hypothetical protein